MESQDIMAPPVIKITDDRGKSRVGTRTQTRVPVLWKKLLRFVHISEITKGTCVYEYKWKWSIDGHSECVGSLVQTFMQFAREVDTGDVSCVNFTLPFAAQMASRLSSGARLGSTHRKNNSLHRQESIKMLWARNADFVAVLFYDDIDFNATADSVGQSFLEKILQKFTETHGNTVKDRDEIRPNEFKSFDGPVVMLQEEFNTEC